MMADDRDFLEGLRRSTLANERFRHVDHVRAAYLCIVDRGYPEGAEALEELIRGFARAHGAPQKFHATLTMGWARLIAAHLAGDAARDFVSFLAKHEKLLDKELLLQYYSAARLFSQEARDRWREPDLEALPTVRPWKSAAASF